MITKAVIVQMTTVSINGSSKTNEPFCNGLVGLYRRVGDRGRAEASFVGKYRPTKANDHDPDEARHRCPAE